MSDLPTSRPAAAGRSRSRVWDAGRPVPLWTTLAPLRRGAGDPSFRRTDGALWRAVRTPVGTATARITRATDTSVEVTSWGEGASWVLDRAPAWLGADDDLEGFDPVDPAVERAWRRHPHLRLPATGLLFEAAVAAVLEQKVTGHEAWAGWRSLLRRHGEPAPGPGAAMDMWVLPTPATVRAIPSWEWRRMPVDHARSATVVRIATRAAARARGLERGDDVAAAMATIPGVGRWTVAETLQRALGHRDLVSFGDYHLAGRVGLALVGRPVDDDGMAEVLERYRPHRYRVQRLVELTGPMAERHGPRMQPRTHLPGRLPVRGTRRPPPA